MQKKQIRSDVHEILTQKRTSGAGGAHKSKAQKKQDKYRHKWRRGEE